MSDTAFKISMAAILLIWAAVWWYVSRDLPTREEAEEWRQEQSRLYREGWYDYPGKNAPYTMEKFLEQRRKEKSGD